MKKISLLFSALSLATTIAVHAQDENLNKEIIVEKDYTPIEQKASKLSLVPPVVQFEPAASNLTFSMQNSPVATGNAISTLPAYGYLTKYVDRDPRGYVNFTMGSYLNINASAGFKLVNTKNTKLALFANHLSTGGVNNDLIYKRYGENQYFPDNSKLKFKQKWNTERIGFNFTQSVGKCFFYTNATYNYSRVRIHKYYWNDTEDFYSYTGSNDIDFNIGIQNINDTPLHFYANASVNYFDYKYSGYNPLKNRQTFVKLNGGISQAVREKYEAGLKIEGNFMHTNLESCDTTSYIPVAYRGPSIHTSDIGFIRLNPYYAKKEGKLKYSIGLNADLRINDGNFLKISPDVKASYDIIKGLSVYGIATGGTYYNQLYDLTMENPYSIPNNRNNKGYLDFIKFNNSSFTQVDAQIGIVVGPFKGLKMKIYGGYANTKDVALPFDIEPYRIFKRINGKEYAYYQLNEGDFFNCNLDGFMWGADIDYSYSGLLDFHFGVKNAKQTNTGNGYLLGKNLPKWVIRTKVGMQPIARLRIDLGYDLQLNRKSIRASYLEYHTSRADYPDIYIPNDGTDLLYFFEDLGNISDLWLHADYRVTDFLNVNIQASNILNKYWRIAGYYRNQGIAVMGGISLRFK